VSLLRDLELEPSDAWVERSATFREATERLVESGLPYIAVLDEEHHVLGFFGENELLQGVFPRYLRELRHTAFTQDDLGWLAHHLGEVGEEPVEGYLHEPVIVDREASATHAAELLLHSDVTALAVAEDGRFVGMLNQRDFCRALLERCQQVER
jgi:CBS domain-containing protein